jgi:hypothetical protein
MAMLTSQSRALLRQQDKMMMAAGIHKSLLIPPMIL